MFDNCIPNVSNCSNNGYYINNSGEIFIVRLTTPTTASYEWYGNFNNSIINGLEFTGGSITTPSLFVAGELYGVGGSINGPPTLGFLKQIDFANNIITDCIPPLAGPNGINPLQNGHLQPKKTFLERTKNGKIAYICYAFNPPTNQYGNRYFVEYDYINQTFNTTQIDVPTGIDLNPNDISPLAANPANTSFLFRTYKYVFTLPDQIDGEDYWKFTNPNIAISNMNINGQYNPNCDPNNWQLVYNCDRINLNVGLESGEACRVDIKYEPVTKECNELPGGFYFFGQLEHAISSTKPINNYNLGDLQNGGGQGLTNQPGYYKITAIVTDCCGNTSSRSTYVRVLSGISPNFNLLVYDFNNSCGGPSGQCYIPMGQNISNALPVGPSTLAYLITANTGNISVLNTLVEEVDNLGNTLNLIINEDYNFQNLTSTLPINLNNFCVPTSLWSATPTSPACNVSSPSPGYSGNLAYFSNISGLNALGKYYRLTVTLSNPCSSLPKWGYFKVVSTIPKPSSVTGIEYLGEDNLNMRVYPNPAKNELSFNFINRSFNPISIVIYDISGRIVKTVKKDSTLATSEQHITTDIQNLENGTYFWNVSGNEINLTGKLIIAK